MSLKNLALDVESIALALSEEGGYEYYRIDDELRELAKDVSDMQAENARLREQIDAAHMFRLLTENENESLRELVRELWEGYADPPCEDCPLKDKPACVDCPICAREAAVIDHMRELGVEVDG